MILDNSVKGDLGFLLREALMKDMIWGQTPQGSGFWVDVYDKLENYSDVNHPIEKGLTWSLQKLLSNCFYWKESAEGHEYWAKVWDALSELNIRINT